MKIAFLINSKIRKLGAVKNEIQLAFKHHDVAFFESEFAGHFFELPKEAINKGYTTIIAIGGDGTLNEMVNGVLNTFKIADTNSSDDYDWKKISEIKIGVYPAGSGNDFVKTVYKNTQLFTLKTLIESNSSQMIDIGFVSFIEKEKGTNATRFFMNITDVGMGGETVVKKDKVPKWMGADFSYFWAITSTVATYKKCNVRCWNDTFSWQGKVINMVVANGKYFGNGLGIAPDADVTDGKFSFVIIGDINLLDYFKNLGTVKKCEKVQHPMVQYNQFEEINIESCDGNKVSIDMDGEFIGYAPLKLTNISKRINFIM